MEVRSQHHTPAALFQENSPRYDWLSGWVSPEIWGGGLFLCRVSKPRPSST